MDSETKQKLVRAIKKGPTWVLQNGKPIFHYGFIPLIIVLGMRTEPRPSWIQLIGPM